MRRLIPFLACVAMLVPLTAQPQASDARNPHFAQTIAADTSGATQTVLTFRIEGQLRDTGGTVTTRVLDILNHLSKDRFLARTSFNGSGSAGAWFVFRSDAEFRQWYTSEPTARLLARLTPLTSSLTYELSMDRYPLTQYVPRALDSVR